MYKEDVKTIKDYVSKGGLPAFEKVFYFVLGSIRTRFYHITDITKDITTKGLDSKHIWGSKVKAYTDFKQVSQTLFESVSESHRDVLSLTKDISNIRGIGIAKASFLLQLLGRETACLDVHNLKLLGVNPDYFKDRKRTEEYVSLVQQRGSEYWWDSWCEHIANTYPKHFKDAEHVSKLHVKAIVQ